MLTRQQRGDAWVLAGAIDEHASLADLAARARDGRLVLELGGVKFVNSIGMREWLKMQREAVKAQLRVELRQVPEIIVHQLNIMTAARGNAIVTSFYAPYVCDDCDRDDSVLLEVTRHGRDLAQRRVPEVRCTCGAAMVLSDPPEIYLSFLG